ncbi:hypothetical protein F5Y00DRAFT_269385 [Daldinia vernicosa]|uniref:uncharacterized protein n=1 Tax=Daldinia vernicosa TaxID=114800 RepID=UPI0020081867|nr:uncharacterized protein F5Y00DRAFT_269385 [Daldinia vernicosa]KAI0849401.1 hypothetical protein F5Y00DRAFT_269385 [Daldinia vernicosa]
MKASCLILAGTFTCHAVADGGYAKNCQNMMLVDLDNSHVGLKASCKAGNKDQCSILNLWQCYGTDNNGALKPQERGAAPRCRSCKLNGTVLQCDCRDRSQGRYHISSVDTNNLIVNDNGVLKCFGNKAITPDDCASKRSSGYGSNLSLVTLGYALSFCGLALIWV